MTSARSLDDLLAQLFPSHERGARSPHAGLQAIYRAEAGFPVFPETLRADSATTDTFEIASNIAKEEKHRWFMRGIANDGLVILKSGSGKDRKLCENEWGRLPATQTVERSGGTHYSIFKRAKSDPVFRLYHPILLDADAWVSAFSQLPGNWHRSGDSWRWRENSAPGEVPISALPKTWIAGLPRRTQESSSLVVTPRYEFDPRQARGWNDWPCNETVGRP